MEFVSAIEAFDQLFVRAEFLADFVEVFQADDFRSGQDRSLQPLIIGQHCRIVRRKPIPNEDKLHSLIGFWLSVSIVQRRQCRNGSARIGKVVAADGSGRRIDDEPGVMPFVFDDEIGFVGGGYRAGFR